MYYVAREAVDNDEYEPDFVLSDKGDDIFAGFEAVETKHEVLEHRVQGQFSARPLRVPERTWPISRFSSVLSSILYRV